MEGAEGAAADSLSLSVWRLGFSVVNEVSIIVGVGDARQGFDNVVGEGEVVLDEFGVVGVGERDPGADDGGDVFEDVGDAFEVGADGAELLAGIFDSVDTALLNRVEAAGVLAVELKAKLFVSESAKFVNGATIST